MIQPGHRVAGGGRPVLILSSRRGYTVRYRSVGITAVGSSAGLGAQRDIGGYRIQSSLELTPSGIAEAFQRTGVGIGHISGESVHLWKVVSELGHLVNQILYLSAAFLKIRIHPAGFYLAINRGNLIRSNCFSHLLKVLCHCGGKFLRLLVGGLFAEIMVNGFFILGRVSFFSSNTSVLMA